MLEGSTERLLRRLRAVSVALVLASLPGPAAGSAPPVATTPFTAAGEAEFTTAAVDELAAYEGVSADEARYRLELESLAADLEPVVAATWPNSFGGLWLRIDGPPGIVIAFTKNGSENVAELATAFARPEALLNVDVERSLADLVALHGQLRSTREAVQNLAAGPIPLAIADTGGTYDIGIDVVTNQVAVYAMEETAELRAAFNALYGDAVRVQGGAMVPACQRHDCRYTMRGGLWLTAPNQQKLCTSSFAAFSGSTYYTLSAGHCTRESGITGRYHGGVNFGSVCSSCWVVARSVDAERIPRQNSVWYMGASIFVEPTDIRPIYQHISWESTAVNTFVGKSGMNSGTTKGYIYDKYLSLSYVPNSERFIGVAACAVVGDSGAPVFRNNTAYGILSGVSGCPNGAFAFGNIVYAMQGLGVSLLSS